MARRKGPGEVLVAIIRDRLDFGRLREELWYRIPVESAKSMLGDRWPPAWVAFYQTKVFGGSAFAIKYFGQVIKIRTVTRAELLPDEPRDARSRRLYYQIFIRSLEELPKPIPSRRLRRLVFIPTTWAKLISAEEINDLYDDSPLEDALWTQLKSWGIDAERQQLVEVGDKKYLLDFAVFCGTGNLDIEADGDGYHAFPEKAAEDNVRNNALASIGWSVLRFGTAHIREEASEYCATTIATKINQLGGIDRKAGLPERLPLKLPDGSYQTDLFSGPPS